MDTLGDDVRRALGIAGADGTAQLALIVDRWEIAVGAEVARHAWPARIARDGTLHVATTSSVWTFELTTLAGEVMAQLQLALGEHAPSGVRFAPGRVPEQATATAASLPPDPQQPPTPADASSLVAGIEDDELRELARRAAAASLAREHRDRRF